MKIMQIRITAETVEWLREKRIFNHNRKYIENIKLGGVIQFLDNIKVEPYTGFYPFVKIIQAGAFSYSHSMHWHPLDLKMGRYNSIAQNVRHRGYNHPSSLISTSPFVYDHGESVINAFIQDYDPPFNLRFQAIQALPAKIDNDVWIGDGVLIYPGINISTGTIIATQSVLTKSTGPYEIWGGNPAKLIKKRFEKEIIDLLLATEWWEYKFTDFKNLPINKPDKFCEIFLKVRNNLEKFSPKLINISEMPGESL